MKINQKVAHQPYYWAFNHALWNVKEHEAVLTGEKFTLVKNQSTLIAYHQLRNMLEELEEQLYEDS